MATRIQGRSYAKINMYLDVLPRRDDGFHDIETIFQTVDLYDVVTMEALPEALEISCTKPELATEENLAWRAADALRRHTGYTGGARIHVEKRIPIAAGLAGGSGNCAVALKGLNALWGLGCSDEELSAIALELGSDVPYCLVGGPRIAVGRGEVLEPLPALVDTWFCLVHPPISISTAAMYNSPLLAKNDAPQSGGKTQAFRDAIEYWQSGNYDAAMFNAMQAPAIHDHPKLGRFMDALEANGCSRAIMSGSGPTVFGIAETQEDAARAALAIDGARTTIAGPVDVGVVIEKETLLS